MSDDLELVIEVFAAEIALAQGQKLEDILPWARGYVVQAEQQYRDAGQPNGDDALSFVLWLLDHWTSSREVGHDG